MLFFEVNCELDMNIDRGKRECAKEISRDEFTDKRNGDIVVLLELNAGKKAKIGIITEKSQPDLKRLDLFMRELITDLSSVTAGDPELPKEEEMGYQIISCEEITLGRLNSLMHRACGIGFLGDADGIIEELGLNGICSGWSDVEYAEYIIEQAQKEELEERIEVSPFRKDLKEEADRITAGCLRDTFTGHPVQYLIRGKSDEIRDSVKILLQSLHRSGRLISKRYCKIPILSGNEISEDGLEKIYRSCIGGTVVLDFLPTRNQHFRPARFEDELLGMISRNIRRYHNQVLTMLCIHEGTDDVQDRVNKYLSGLRIVKIEEEKLSSCEALRYLYDLAETNHVDSDRSLDQEISGENTYTITELRDIFQAWQDSRLMTSVYPQYQTVSLVSNEPDVRKERGSSAYDELMKMTGLQEAKKVIDRAIAYFQCEKLYFEKGIKQERPEMHMVFTGESGTAKTTVARLFAEIMKEKGILKGGQLIEVGRGDLVGRYVGWTANIVKDKFEKAKGGVLFIDEAYSLVDDRDGSFGDEAINTIVQEMENHRDELVVIFAGYPEPMERFLAKNPGLRSRIAFHVPFQNYDADELLNIARFMAEQSQFTLSDMAEKKLLDVFREVKDEPDFGNGRFVRNVIEKAKMNLAERIASLPEEQIDVKILTTIEEKDIDEPAHRKAEKQKIGFCGSAA